LFRLRDRPDDVGSEHKVFPFAPSKAKDWYPHTDNKDDGEVVRTAKEMFKVGKKYQTVSSELLVERELFRREDDRSRVDFFSSFTLVLLSLIILRHEEAVLRPRR
jgi:uncharacterized protein YdaT